MQPGLRCGHIGGTGRQVQLIAYGAGLFGEVELGQQLAQVVEHRSQEGFLCIARRRPQRMGQLAGQQRAQELLLQPLRVGLVFHVLDQHQRQGQVADAGQADQRNGPRDGAHAMAVAAQVRGVDQTQQLLCQRHVLENLIGQRVQALGLGVGHALDAQHLLGQRREVALVAHAAQQEVQRAVAAAGLGQGLVDRRQPLHQRITQAGGGVVALGRVAGDGALPAAASGDR